jgi:flagellin
MSRINTNIASMNAINKLVANNSDLTTRLKRLSSGLRINTGKDDPAGLIASENLRSEIAGINAGVTNSTRASSVIATAEGALNEISSLLVDIRGLLVSSANTGALSSEEIDANQLQVDSAINSISRISNATEFEGMKLLNGNKAYTTSSVGASAISQLKVNAAKLINGATMSVIVARTAAADTGKMYLSGAVSATTAITIQIGSNRGTTELTLAAGTTAADQRTAINALTQVTGVSAVASGNVTVLRSRDFGADAYVSVEILGNGAAQTGAASIRVMKTYGASTTTGQAYGTNMTATVNGTSATASGKKLTVRTSMLDAEIDVGAAYALSTANFNKTFGITGGGADFAIGSRVDAIGLESLGIMNVAPTQLGNTTDGYLNTLKSGMTNALSSGNLVTAQQIVDSAIKDISQLRGRLGAFQKNILETNINSLKITLENVTSSESAIRDADFATETAALTRAQILVQANTSILSIANSMPQSVLALLGK